VTCHTHHQDLHLQQQQQVLLLLRQQVVQVVRVQRHPRMPLLLPAQGLWQHLPSLHLLPPLHLLQVQTHLGMPLLLPDEGRCQHLHLLLPPLAAAAAVALVRAPGTP
jgi:hypothetical protein